MPIGNAPLRIRARLLSGRRGYLTARLCDNKTFIGRSGSRGREGEEEGRALARRRLEPGPAAVAIDIAFEVVGIGSVGTRCWVVLLLAEDGNPLIMQVKEARKSVLEPFAGAGPYQTIRAGAWSRGSG